jgi:hypothetical protein
MEIVGTNMQDKLSSSLGTFSQSSRKTVSSLIRDMKLDKIDFKSLLDKLSSSDIISEFRVAQMRELSFLNRENVMELFRNSSLKLDQLFTSANAAGVIIDSMVNIFSADIAKLEEELKNLELFINNYEFLAGKDDLYNANYIERFDNSNNDYRFDNYNFAIPDRNNVSFPDSGNAFVDSSTGTLKIGSSQRVVNILDNIKSIKRMSNYDNFITSQTSFDGVFTQILTDSWATTIKSPTILTSALSDYAKYIPYNDSSYNGARTAVEVELLVPISMDTIKLTPTIGNGLALMQVVIFNSPMSDSSGSNPSESYQTLLLEPKYLSKDLEISFESTFVSKLIFIFNQTSYVRSKSLPIISELNSKALQSYINDRITENRTTFSVNQDIAYFYFANKYLIEGIKKNKNQNMNYYSYRFPFEAFSYDRIIENEIYKASTVDLGDRPDFINSPIFTSLVRNMLSAMNVDDKFFEANFYIQSAGNSKFNFLNSPGFMSVKPVNANDDHKSQFYKDNVGVGNASIAVKDLLINEQKDIYEYTFSIKSISFIETIEDFAERACFVSRKIPVDGEIAAVKAKLESLDQNITVSSDGYDLKESVSFELSISNIDTPSSESDWIPLSFNNKSTVDSEVVFFDPNSFFATLRFVPKADSIILYQNGKVVHPDSYIFRVNSQRLELTAPIFSRTDIFCASYEIDSSLINPFELDLIKNNQYKESTKQFKTSNGLGEPFSRTSSSASITLSEVPYLNRSFVSSARYDKYYGTLFSGVGYGYSPVRVKLNDGTYAVNVTNYTPKAQQVEFQNGSSTQFIHNGKNIVFNKVIDNGFTVEYEYIPHNLRFRLVMRKNIPGISIPAKADSVILKMKTMFFDTYYDKLNNISLN